MPNRFWKEFGVPTVERTSIWTSVNELFMNDLHELDAERVKKYGKIYGFYMFGQPNLMVADPSLVRDILVKDFYNFRNTMDFSQFVNEDDIANFSLFSSRNETWKRIRTIISPVFSTGKIKKMLPHLCDSSKTLLRHLTEAAQTGKGVDVTKFYETFSMDVIASAAYGMKIDSYNDPQNDFVVNAKKFFAMDLDVKFLILVLFPRLGKFLRIPMMNEEATNFFKKVVTKIIKQRREENKKYNDFIQLMMDACADDAENSATENDDEVSKLKGSAENMDSALKINKVLSPDEVISNSIMFFFVAFATTSFTLAYTTCQLALNPECQEKLIEEVDETLRNNGMELPYYAIQNMKYLDMVISEILRLYPFAVRIMREAEDDYVLKETGMKVPKKTLVNISSYAIHHDPEFYPDPEKFDPNRFSPEECAKRDPYTYIPFSTGPRNCIGMRFALFEMKACLAHVLSRFRFKRCPETIVPLKMKTRGQAALTTKIILLVEERTDKVVDFLR